MTSTPWLAQTKFGVQEAGLLSRHVCCVRCDHSEALPEGVEVGTIIFVDHFLQPSVVRFVRQPVT
jgi:hypothetical protein